jgi:hypothetical protein
VVVVVVVVAGSEWYRIDDVDRSRGIWKGGSQAPSQAGGTCEDFGEVWQGKAVSGAGGVSLRRVFKSGEDEVVYGVWSGPGGSGGV